MDGVLSNGIKRLFQSFWWHCSSNNGRGPLQGRIQDFKLGGGAHLKKLRRAEGGAKNVGVFRVKNHDFTPKKSDFFQMQREARKCLGYFVWKITILRQKIIFFPILLHIYATLWPRRKISKTWCFSSNMSIKTNNFKTITVSLK